MKDLMVDIETLGTLYPVVGSVGLCWFDLDDKTIGVPEVLRLDLDAQQTTGQVELRTLTWWLAQDPAVMRDTFLDGPRYHPAEAFGKVLVPHVKVAERVWAKGTDFDLRILNEMYSDWRHQLSQDDQDNEYPDRLIPFWKWRDCRALFDLGKRMKANFPQRDDTMPAHDAGADAYYQAKVVLHVAGALT